LFRSGGLVLAGYITFLAALIGGLALTPVARLVARRRGVVDHPDGQRKLHGRPVPLWGGVALYLALLVGLAAAELTGLPDQGSVLLRLTTVVALAAGAVCLLGGVDDSLDLNPRLKLLLQTASTIPIVLAGYWAERITVFGYGIELGWCGALVTIVWLVACINAINLLDGMDGLAATIGLLMALVVGLIAAAGGHPPVAVIAMALGGALGGFLVYNLPPASIYLGDSGSMVIGLVVGLLALQASLVGESTLSITLPAVIMTIPLLDATLAVVRRRLSGRPFDAADRGHIHHRLLARGLSRWQTLAVISLLCLATGTAAVLTRAAGNDALAWIAAGVVVVLLVATHAFGNHELALLKLAAAHMTSRALRRLANSRVAGRRRATSRQALAEMPFDIAWRLLVSQVRPLQVHRLEVSLSSATPHAEYTQAWSDPIGPPPSGLHWSFVMTFPAPDGSACQLRALGTDAGISQQWAVAKLMQALQPFGEHWAATAPADSLVTLPLAAADAPGSLKTQQTARSGREAA
jgi:UDP-GlcNAc:undecaprenyl-phosphate GlcNAc-1-phosphate transferase